MGSATAPAVLAWHLPIITCSGRWRIAWHGLHLANFEEVQNWLAEWFRSKDTSFYRRDIHVLP